MAWSFCEDPVMQLPAERPIPSGEENNPYLIKFGVHPDVMDFKMVQLLNGHTCTDMLSLRNEQNCPRPTKRLKKIVPRKILWMDTTRPIRKKVGKNIDWPNKELLFSLMGKQLI